MPSPYPLDLKIGFRQILDEYVACLASNAQNGVFWPFDELPFFFDLDRLWFNPQALDRTADLLFNFLYSLRETLPFDTIATPTSNAGSFGPIPLASILAQRLSLSLLIFRETDFAKYKLYPLTYRYAATVTEKRILLLKDVLVRGGSLKNVARMINQRNGICSAVLTLVDFKPSDREGYPPPELANTPLYTIITRGDFAALRKGELE